MRSVFTYQKLEESNFRKILEMQGKTSCKTRAIAIVFPLVPDCHRKQRKIVNEEAKQNSKPTKPPKTQQTQIRQSPASVKCQKPA